jgi:putative transposase
MARRARSVTDGEIYHVINRGNCRMPIFGKPADYLAFLRLMEQGRQRTGMRILAFCLMPNHWHMVLWPKRAKDLAAFVGWVSNTHVRRWREHRRSVGQGHLYQGRFKSFPAQSGKGLYEVLRYVEGNARRAKRVEAAELWPYGSLFAGPRRAEDQVTLTPWPVPRPADWAAKVNKPIAAAELNRLRLHLLRDRPYGDPAWTAAAAKRMGLQWTFRDRGRPKKKVQKGRDKEK